MRSAARIAIVLLSTLSPVGFTSCDDHGPSSPTPTPSAVSPLSPGAYLFTLFSVASDGCRGGNYPDVLPGGSAFQVLQLELDGSGWVGRPLTPGTGDLELRLQRRAGEVTVAGTMRGHSEFVPASQASVDISQPATVDGHLVVGSTTQVFGTARGEVVYDDPIAGRRTCSSASWILEPTRQL